MSELPQALLDGIQSIYDELAQELAELSPVCKASGNCCDFPNYDHTLFCTTVEAERLLAITPIAEHLERTQTELCPYWVERRCTAREGRPLGCRVFFCDEVYKSEHSQRVYEKYHAKLRELIESCGESYAYVPMVSAINRKLIEDRWFDPARPYATFPQ